jgi:hypothetical protein
LAEAQERVTPARKAAEAATAKIRGMPEYEEMVRVFAQRLAGMQN